MKTEKNAEDSPSHLPPHHISEALKKEMEKAKKEPPDPNSFLDRLRKK
jgi:hypothetical protein